MDNTTRPLAAPTPSSAQLHGLACIICGSEMDGLIACGHVYTPADPPGSQVGWAVVACPQHRALGEAQCARTEAAA